MKIIGICGSSGSGKSTFAKCFSKKGYPVFDCDEIYHDLISSPSACLLEISKEFGDSVIKNGALDRKALGSIVFSDSKKRNKLNTITHKFVLDELREKLSHAKNQGFELCVIDAPLLFEAGLDAWCDFVCCVDSSEDLQIQRICERDKISRDDALLRIQSQLKTQSLADRCDAVVLNHGDLASLESECNKIINLLQ